MIYQEAEQAQIRLNMANNPLPSNVGEISERQWLQLERTKSITLFAGSVYEYAEHLISNHLEREWWLAVLPQPKKQNIHERAWLNYVSSSVPSLEGVELLPNRGVNSLFIDRISPQPVAGELVRKENLSKSLDARGILRRLDGTSIPVYFVLKYTEQAGGHQSNQLNDALLALSESTPTQDFLTIAVLDGAFYQSNGRFERAKGFQGRKSLVTTYRALQRDLMSFR